MTRVSARAKIKKKNRKHIFFSIHKENCSQFLSICCSTYIHLVRVTQTWNWVTKAISSILSTWLHIWICRMYFIQLTCKTFCISTFARVLQLAASAHKVISVTLPTEKWTRIFFYRIISFVEYKRLFFIFPFFRTCYARIYMHMVLRFWSVQCSFVTTHEKLKYTQTRIVGFPLNSTIDSNLQTHWATNGLVGILNQNKTNDGTVTARPILTKHFVLINMQNCLKITWPKPLDYQKG